MADVTEKRIFFYCFGVKARGLYVPLAGFGEFLQLGVTMPGLFAFFSLNGLLHGGCCDAKES
jgi:hypothetical protein